ncbi:auxin-responsive protein SAUR68-like [Asparagus officinalis]|uniref:auxin-responsive protein SAUR68-like n=1 Tax=Asparagus officinalis TaxID=4686 RepID=UPI00098E0F1F|nr:auxin-responsive protein SAUR68-like [Asparagus officinalis]
MVKKWRKMAALGRRRIMSSSTSAYSPCLADKGHIFVYSSDSKRFMIPLSFLGQTIFRELFRLAEEEFGLPKDGPIVLPCDALSLAGIISMLHRRGSKDEKSDALMFSAGDQCFSSSLSLKRDDQQQCVTVYGF